MRADRFCSLLPIVLLLTVGLLLYGPFVRHGYVDFDDTTLITRNPAVQELSPRTVAYVFTSYDPELYIPLTLLTYQVEHALFGEAPAVTHAVNVLLHLLCAVLVFLLLRRLTTPWIALATALLFLVHPLHTEAVLWAAARKDVLSAALALGSLLAWQQWLDADARRWYAASVLLFFFALLAKVTVLLLPAVLLVLWWVHGLDRRRRVVRALTPFVALSAAFFGIALGGKHEAVAALTPLDFVLLSVRSAVFLLQKVVWPAHLSVLYPQALPVSLATTQFLPSLAVLILLAVVVMIAARRSRVAVFGATLAVLFFLPSCITFAKAGFVYLTSDRYAYLSSIGVFLCGALAVRAVLRRFPAWSVSVVAVVVALVLIPRTVTQAASWATTETLFRQVLTLYPNNALAYNNIGAAKLRDGETDAAMQLFARAADSEPLYARPLLNIGDVERKNGHISEALDAYRSATERVRRKTLWTSDDVNAFAVYGDALAHLGRREEALALLREAEERAPDIAAAHFNVAMVLLQDDRRQEAEEALRRTLELEPRSVEAQYHYASLLAARGDLAGAEEYLLRVLRRAPNYADAREHLTAIRRLRATGSEPAVPL